MLHSIPISIFPTSSPTSVKLLMLNHLLIKNTCETEENVKLYPKFVFLIPTIGNFLVNIKPSALK